MKHRDEDYPYFDLDGYYFKELLFSLSSVPTNKDPKEGDPNYYMKNLAQKYKNNNLDVVYSTKISVLKMISESFSLKNKFHEDCLEVAPKKVYWNCLTKEEIIEIVIHSFNLAYKPIKYIENLRYLIRYSGICQIFEKNKFLIDLGLNDPDKFGKFSNQVHLFTVYHFGKDYYKDNFNKVIREKVLNYIYDGKSWAFDYLDAVKYLSYQELITVQLCINAAFDEKIRKMFYKDLQFIVNLELPEKRNHPNIIKEYFLEKRSDLNTITRDLTYTCGTLGIYIVDHRFSQFSSYRSFEPKIKLCSKFFSSVGICRKLKESNLKKK